MPDTATMGWLPVATLIIGYAGIYPEAWAKWKSFHYESRIFDFELGGSLVSLRNYAVGPEMMPQPR